MVEQHFRQLLVPTGKETVLNRRGIKDGSRKRAGAKKATRGKAIWQATGVGGVSKKFAIDW